MTSIFELKRAPTHPGAILREDVLPSLEGCTVSRLAEQLGITRQAMHNILAEKSSLSPAVALRLGRLLGNSPEMWLGLQSRYDLWQALQAETAA
jgi:antitoxin HigA-1